MSKTKGQPRERATRDYEPSPRDLEIYQELCKGRTLRDVGTEFNLSHERIRQLRNKVRRYLSPKLQKEIARIRVDQTMALEHLYREMMAAWEKSKVPPTEEIDTVSGAEGENTSHTVKRKSTCGDPVYAAQARAALADIRALWNVAEHSEAEEEDKFSVPRPCGMDRDEWRMLYAKIRAREYLELIDDLKDVGIKEPTYEEIDADREKNPDKYAGA